IEGFRQLQVINQGPPCNVGIIEFLSIMCAEFSFTDLCKSFKSSKEFMDECTFIFIIKRLHPEGQVIVFTGDITCRDADNPSKLSIYPCPVVEYFNGLIVVNMKPHFVLPKLFPFFIQSVIFRSKGDRFYINKYYLLH